MTPQEAELLYRQAILTAPLPGHQKVSPLGWMMQKLREPDPLTGMRGADFIPGPQQKIAWEDAREFERMREQMDHPLGKALATAGQGASFAEGLPLIGLALKPGAKLTKKAVDKMMDMYRPASKSINKRAQDLAKFHAETPRITHPDGRVTYADADEMAQITQGQNLLPNPERGRVANEVERAQKWAALDKATTQAGVKRNAKTGRYVGAGVGITSPQKKTALATKYKQRIQDSLDAGIEPGYFYEKGAQKLGKMTDSPAERQLAAQLMGPTSTEVGPYQNTNYMVRAFDQHEMGVPTSVTKYPNSQRPRVDAILHGQDPWKGYKVDRYSNLLGAGDKHTNPLGMMPPNDQWEGLGTGLKKGQVPAGPTQVAFSDRIRGDAVDRLNVERAAQGLDPLSLPEAQELHWAAIRAQHEGRPLQLNPGDTIQGSAPSFKFQHSFEAEPGKKSGLTRVTDKQDYFDQIAPIFKDEQGKDPLIRAMGGRLQEPSITGPGVFEGNISPGAQSHSFVSHTAKDGIDPASMARVDSTEAIRQWMLAQDARAGHVFVPGRAPSANAVPTAQLPGKFTDQQVLDIEGRLGSAISPVPSEEGLRLLDFSGGKPADFKAKIADLNPSAMGASHTMYGEYEPGQFTKGMLDTLDEHAKLHPGVLGKADSPATRDIAGQMADVYRRLESEGKLTGSQKFQTALEAYKTRGLAGVRELVAKGLAPAALIGALGIASLDEQSSEYN